MYYNTPRLTLVCDDLIVDKINDDCIFSVPYLI